MPPSAPSKAEKVTTSAATMLEMLGKLLQGTQQQSPGQQTAARSGSIPSVAAPVPTAIGAARQFPNFVQAPMPMPSQPQPPGGLLTGSEFRTEGGKNAAIATGAIANIAGAIADYKREQVEKQHFKMANTIALADALYKSGRQEDTDAADAMIRDPKFIKQAERYLIGDFPRVSAKKTTTEQPQGAVPVPGGAAQPQTQSWTPSASPEAVMKAKAMQLLQDEMEGKVQLNDNQRKLVGIVLGKEAAMSPSEYQNSVRISSGIQADANTVATLKNRYDINLQQMGQQHEQFLTETGERALALDKEIKSRESIAKIGDATQNAAIRAQYDASVGFLRGGKKWEETMAGALAVYNQTKNTQNLALQALEANKRLQASIMTSKASLNKYDTAEAKAQMKDLDEKFAFYEQQNKQFQAIISQSGARKWEKLLDEDKK